MNSYIASFECVPARFASALGALSPSVSRRRARAAGVFSKAKIPPATAVVLMLGADVLLELPLEEARDRLVTTMEATTVELESNNARWAKVCECKTTTEVNVARVHNYDVEQRKSRQGKQQCKQQGKQGPLDSIAE